MPPGAATERHVTTGRTLPDAALGGSATQIPLRRPHCPSARQLRPSPQGAVGAGVRRASSQRLPHPLVGCTLLLMPSRAEGHTCCRPYSECSDAAPARDSINCNCEFNVAFEGSGPQQRPMVLMRCRAERYPVIVLLCRADGRGLLKARAGCTGFISRAPVELVRGTLVQGNRPNRECLAGCRPLGRAGFGQLAVRSSRACCKTGTDRGCC